MVIVLGNKTDLHERRQVEPEAAQQWARGEKLRLWEVSVTERESLIEPFTVLTSRLTQPPSKSSFPLPGRRSKGTPSNDMWPPQGGAVHGAKPTPAHWSVNGPRAIKQMILWFMFYFFFTSSPWKSVIAPTTTKEDTFRVCSSVYFVSFVYFFFFFCNLFFFCTLCSAFKTRCSVEMKQSQVTNIVTWARRVKQRIRIQLFAQTLDVVSLCNAVILQARRGNSMGNSIPSVSEHFEYYSMKKRWLEIK